jgi:hypothetical protein
MNAACLNFCKCWYLSFADIYTMFFKPHFCLYIVIVFFFK